VTAVLALPRGLIALTLVGGALLSGCSPTEPGRASPPASVVEAYQAATAEGDASRVQLAVLETALSESREITEEEYRAAYQLAVECTRDSGVNVLEVQEIYDAGNLQLYMVVNGREKDEDFMFSAMGSCEHKHSSYIDLARQLSETATEQREAIIDSYLPRLLECVRSKGAALPDDASFDDVVSEDLDAQGGSDPATSCMVRTGLQAALDAPPA
jgi:hypothetical protein